jgi:hypothetical protein
MSNTHNTTASQRHINITIHQYKFLKSKERRLNEEDCIFGSIIMIIVVIIFPRAKSFHNPITLWLIVVWTWNKHLKKRHHYLVYKTEFHVKRAALGEANRNLAAPWRVCMMLVFASPRDFRFQPLPIPIFFSSNVSRLFQSSAKFGRKVTHLTKNFRLIFRPIFGRLERALVQYQMGFLGFSGAAVPKVKSKSLSRPGRTRCMKSWNHTQT